MILTLIWINFIILMGFLEELDQVHYLLFSSLMFYFTYLYNKIIPSYISIKLTLLLISISSLILWYIIFVYNDFLSMKPLSNELLIYLFFIYIYLTIYIFFES